MDAGHGGHAVWTVNACLNARIVDSIPTRGKDVCVRLYCVRAVLYVGIGLATGWSPVQGDLQTIYIVSRLLRAITVEPEKQPLLANGSETTFVSR
jgi:hypothetical protein